MKYEMMFPDDIKRAIDNNTPLVLPVGVLEHHAGHLPTGVDGLLVVKAVELIEKESDIAVLPPFYYGSASTAVACPGASGTVDVDSNAVHGFARSLFDSLLAEGFRNIHVFIHHQTENFSSGMPVDLAFRFAAKQALFSLLEREMGDGWWGDDRMKDYYDRHSAGDDPFSWISVHPLMDEETQKLFPIDHAGKQETSLMLAFCPELVKRENICGGRWYAETAREASLEYGEKEKAMILEKMRRLLKP